MSAPVIPKRVSSLLSAPAKDQMKALELKKEVIASQVSLDSSPDEFVAAKLDDFEASLEIKEIMKRTLTEGLTQGKITREEYNESVTELDNEFEPMEKEMVYVKRQRKTLVENMEESLNHTTVEDAYVSLMRDNVMKATFQNPPLYSAQQKKKWRDRCMKYYDAEGENEKAWCSITGWHHRSMLTAAHIVPKSLSSPDLAYFFGADYIGLMQPRNGLMLLRQLELALDNGTMVIVPLSPQPGEETRWKCILTQKSMLDFIVAGGTWRDYDGKELKFRGPNRPARRYLYFRFVITYLQCAKMGPVTWESEVDVKGTLWASPGKYVKTSMLVLFAKNVGDFTFPEAFYNQTTFSEIKGKSSRTKDEEETDATYLTHRIREHQERATDPEWADFSTDEDDVEDDTEDETV